jgi:hypothetical protein
MNKYLFLLFVMVLSINCKNQPLPTQDVPQAMKDSIEATKKAALQEFAQGAILSAKKYLDCFAIEDTSCLRSVVAPDSPASQLELIIPLFTSYKNITIGIARLVADEIDSSKAIVKAYYVMKAEPENAEYPTLDSQQQIDMEVVNLAGEWKISNSGM